jgi:hypothetical protein
MDTYLTAAGTPGDLSTRTCNECLALHSNTYGENGAVHTRTHCGLSGARVTPATKACIFYPRVNHWVKVEDTNLVPSSAPQSPAA